MRNPMGDVETIIVHPDLAIRWHEHARQIVANPESTKSLRALAWAVLRGRK
jgi:hypothetical protein